MRTKMITSVVAVLWPLLFVAAFFCITNFDDIRKAYLSSGLSGLFNIAARHGTVYDTDGELPPTHLAVTNAVPEAMTEISPLAPPQKITLTVGNGDTLASLLYEADVPGTQAQMAIDALREVYDPKSLKTGQDIDLLFNAGTGGRFVGLEFATDAASSFSVARIGEHSFRAQESRKKVIKRLVAASGTIDNSLFSAGISAGVPISVLASMLKLYAFDVDFQRDIRNGDKFNVLFEREFTEDGQPVREGNILYANMSLQNRAMPRYRFVMADGIADMFDSKGQSARKALMRTPIDGARITSNFGRRKHPILGYGKAHKGVDFGAPKGTPIYAAGNGSIDFVGLKGGYGNYIRIRHNSLISTAYAHMSRFAKGIRRGTRVAQGEVIGYVGSTGRSTGPHLHYEVIRSGQQANPMTIDLPSGKKLQGKELKTYLARTKEVDTAFREISEGLQVAEIGMRTF